MEKDEIKEFVDRKLAEAKLEVAEKRLQFVMWVAGALVAIFGVFLPLWLTNRSSDKVDNALQQMRQESNQTSQGLRTDSRASAESLDKAMLTNRADIRSERESQSRQLGNTVARVDNAIQDMQKQFKELAGAQIKKPVLELFVGGSSLEGAVLKLSPTHQTVTINIKNAGDASARNIRIRLYSNSTADCYYFGSWRLLPVSDEPTYKCSFESYEIDPIDPKESRPFNLPMANNIKPGNYSFLLKVFYEQTEPQRYSFTIKVDDKE